MGRLVGGGGWQGGCRWKDRQGVRQSWGPVDKTPSDGGQLPGGMDALSCRHCEEACGVVRSRGWGGQGGSRTDRPDNGRAFPVMSDRDPPARLLTPTPAPSPWQQRGSQDARGKRQDLPRGNAPFSPALGALGWCPVSACTECWEMLRQ